MSIGQESRNFLPRTLIYALSLSILAWFLHVEFGAADWPGPLGWAVAMLNLPVATFWLFFPHIFCLDYWYGRVYETFPAKTFYLHMFSATVAYWACLKVPAVYRAINCRFSPLPAESTLEQLLPEKRDSRKHRYLEAGHRLTVAFLLTCSVWYIHACPTTENWSYWLLLDVSTLVNFPVALAGSIFPPELRGLDVWFWYPRPVEMDNARLERHLLLGMPVYFLILYGWAKLLDHLPSRSRR